MHFRLTADYDSGVDRHFQHVQRKLNWLVFLEQVSAKSLFIPLAVVVPTVIFHVGLHRAFPVRETLLVGAAVLAGWAAVDTWQRRYREPEVRAYVDAWLGGTGEVLVGRWTRREDQPVAAPHTAWKKTFGRWLPTLLATAFVWQVPVLEKQLPPKVFAPDTKRLEEKVEELDALALLPELKKDELQKELEQFQEAAKQMSTEEFWHASDQFDKQIDKALAESQSTFESAAAELAKLANTPSALNTPGLQSAANFKALAEALAQTLKSMPPGAGMTGLTPEQAEKLAEMMRDAKAGNLGNLAEALKKLSPEELQALADQMEKQGGQCQARRGGAGVPGSADSALGSQLDSEGYSEVEDMDVEEEGSGRGGVTRGPGTNKRLFGSESPELQKAMENALLPASGAQDPGEPLQKTQIPSTPNVNPANWNQPGMAGTAATGNEAPGTAAATVAPRYRKAVGSYFSNQQP